MSSLAAEQRWQPGKWPVSGYQKGARLFISLALLIIMLPAFGRALGRLALAWAVHASFLLLR